MIALANDCLVFRLATGERVPYSVDMIEIAMFGEAVSWFDSEFVRHAANAVFYHFKCDLGRETVTVGEFAEALEKVLTKFKFAAEASQQSPVHQGQPTS